MLTSQNLDQIKNYFAEIRRQLDPSLYWAHYETFVKKPYLLGALDPGAAYAQTAAVTAPDARKAMSANPVFCVSGTNMTTALSTFAAGGGITLTTAGANNDQAILQPIGITTANSDLVSAFGPTGGASSVLNTSNQPQIHATLSLSSIAAVRLAFGLKLTNAPDISTDNEAAEIMFSTSGAVSTSAFTVNTSIGGTDTESLTADRYGASVAPVAATTFYLGIIVDADRQPHYYVNGVQVGVGAAMTASTGLWPVIGIQGLTGAAKAVTIRNLTIGAKF